MIDLWYRWRFNITLGAIAVVLFIIGMIMTFWTVDQEEDRWKTTCDQLDAEVFKGPAGYACIRDGKAVYQE